MTLSEALHVLHRRWINISIDVGAVIGVLGGAFVGWWVVVVPVGWLIWDGFKTWKLMRDFERQCEEEPDDDLGWWTIPGDVMLDMLRRAHLGEDPDTVYAEQYANAEHHYPED